ncbi:MAG: TetR/AcrR family transcriptional regulator [Syntrophomonadaceae bacterium]|nr:TetR/AcrR family transcriptional regulator [Syntrophomonadaceae bacterium]
MESKNDKMKQRVILACRDLVQNRGLHNLTMDKLAAHAGLSKRTIYRHFKSKEEIIEASLELFLADTIEHLDQILVKEKNPTQIISNLFPYIYQQGQFLLNKEGLNDLRQHYPQLWRKIKTIREERIKTLTALLIEKSDENAVVRQINPCIVNEVILASINAVVTPDFILENNLTFEEITEQMGKILTRLFLP